MGPGVVPVPMAHLAGAAAALGVVIVSAAVRRSCASRPLGGTVA
jgi:hypothetical protein